MLIHFFATGDYVRYGPSKLIISRDHAIKGEKDKGKPRNEQYLLLHRHLFSQKSKAYRAFEMTPTAHDLQSTVDKTAHSRKRRVMSQAFSDTALKFLEEHIHRHVDIFVKCLADRDSSRTNNGKDLWTHPKNVAQWCNFLSFDLMAELVFGKSFQILEQFDNRYIIDLIQYTAFRVGVCLQMPELAQWNVDKVVAPNVRSLRDQCVALSKKMAVDRVNMDTTRQDLFSHILAARDPETGKGFSLDELWGESTLLTVAGSDAISTGMAGCFFYLSHHEHAYEKARNEVRSAFTSARDIKSGHTLNSCVFLRACIEESLRMSPPVGGALWREVENGGLYIGKSWSQKAAMLASVSTLSNTTKDTSQHHSLIPQSGGLSAQKILSTQLLRQRAHSHPFPLDRWAAWARILLTWSL